MRALAVVPVVLFHAGVPGFGAGYLGVDIFFVISGYLISAILLREIAAGDFSILGFYERRARRILPALFVVTLTTAVAALWILAPAQLEELGESILATALFYSNYYFLDQTGYFATAAELQPMLHTWSLAVEEQFYIVYPLLLVAIARYRRFGVNQMLMALGLFSLIAAEVTTRIWPDVAFFSFHTRAFELIAGALVAANAAAIARVPKPLAAGFAAAGLVGCGLAFCFFPDDPAHPGLVTMSMIVSVVLIVAFARADNLAGRLLGLSVFVGLGLLSYSLYLWHQPLFALYRVARIDEPGYAEMLPLAAVALALAYLSWRFVEQPFRDANVVPARAMARAAAAFVMVPLLMGFALQETEGLPSRVGPAAGVILEKMQEGGRQRSIGIKMARCHFNEKHVSFDRFLQDWDCLPDVASGLPPVVVYGDSHSADKAWALRMAGAEVGNMGGAGCPLAPTSKHPACRRMMEEVLGFARSGRIAGIVIAQRWNADDLDPAELKRIADFWREADVPVFVFTQMPEFGRLRDRIAGRALRGQPLGGLTVDHPTLESGDAAIRAVFTAPHFTVFDTSAGFCGGDKHACEALEDGEPLLIDYGHLAPRGARRLGEAVVNSREWQEWLSSIKPRAGIVSN